MLATNIQPNNIIHILITSVWPKIAIKCLKSILVKVDIFLVYLILPFSKFFLVYLDTDSSYGKMNVRFEIRYMAK